MSKWVDLKSWSSQNFSEVLF